jgi:hypothetical protein
MWENVHKRRHLESAFVLQDPAESGKFSPPGPAQTPPSRLTPRRAAAQTASGDLAMGANGDEQHWTEQCKDEQCRDEQYIGTSSLNGQLSGHSVGQAVTHIGGRGVALTMFCATSSHLLCRTATGRVRVVKE